MPERTIMKMRAWVVGCLFALCAATEAGAQAPSEPVVLAGGALTVGGDISATVRIRGPRLLQLHRLRAFRRCGCCASTSAPRSAPAVTCRSSAKSAARMAGGPRAYALYVRVRPWRPQAVRHPDRAGSSDFRRVSAAHLRDRQPADRLSARLSIPDLDSSRRAAGQRRRTAADARPRLAGRLSRVGRPAADRRLPLVTASSVGTPGVQVARRQPISWTLTASITAGTLSNPLVRDDNAGKQVAGRVAVSSDPRPDCRSIGRARAVRLEPRCRPHPVGSGDRAFAQTGMGRRRRIFPGLLSRAARDGRQRLDAAVDSARRSSTLPCERWPRRSRDATSCALACTSRHDSTIWASARSPARQVRAPGMLR